MDGNFVRPTLVYVGGVFDLTHIGHFNLFSRCHTIKRPGAEKQKTQVLAVVNSDYFSSAYKRKPILTEQERLAAVKACRYVDHAMLLASGEMQPWLLEDIRPDYIVHGSDWTGPDLARQMGVSVPWMAERGIEFRYLTYTEGISSSIILQRVKDFFQNLTST